MRALVLVALAGSAACNAVFGLDPPGLRDDTIDAPDAPVIDGDGGDPIDGGDAGDGVRDGPDAPPPPVDGPDASPSGDSDGDGWINSVDNCPDVANPGQDNEDDDAMGDVCDLCPVRADPGPVPNVDGDGIADDCGDPQTAVSHCIVWFDGFRYPRTHDNYLTAPGVHGAWVFVGGRLFQTNADVDEGIRTLAGLTFTRPTVITRAIVTARGSAGPLDTWQVGVLSNLSQLEQPEVAGVYGSALQLSSAGNANVAVRRRDSNGDGSQVNTLAFPLQSSADVFVALDVRSDVQFAAVSPAGFPNAVPAGIVGPPPPPGPVGLRTHNLSVGFEFLLVLEPSTGNCPVRTEPP